MTFAHIEYLFALLLIIPILIMLYKYHIWRQSYMAKMKMLFKENSIDFTYFKLSLKVLIVVLFIFGFADPLISLEARKIQNEGVDIIVAMDISTSMLAKDVQPSRLERAKLLVTKIIKQQDNNRLGLIFFAGKAYLQMPLSIDKDAAQMYISGASPNLAPMQGTNIADAVQLAVKAFNKAEKKYKVLIIITDGEDHEGADDEAIKVAQENGIVIHTIGVGTTTPTPIQLLDGTCKLDRDGKQVLSAINKEMIAQLAKNGGGNSYFISNQSDPISKVLNDINTMDKKQYEEKQYASNDHQFVYLFLAILVLAVFDFILPTRIDKQLLLKFKNK